eukprot:TRINITY_DN11709_c0_g1_i2.p1 TRINITY_DN11709_c0_g1~~TRINITY_DN11709_c0_g1_i2.p1  ORF type:complete len:329 (-),score=111.18 TRINITY_DN11709_c0_g1_i2:147-1133(-)
MYMVELAGISEEGLKALQVMQLTLQSLEYRKRISVDEARRVKEYLEKQEKEVEGCKKVLKKQKERVKDGERIVEGINEEALNYELLVKRIYPEILDKNGELYKDIERDNEMLITEAVKGKSLYNAFESRERTISKAKKAQTEKGFMPAPKETKKNTLKTVMTFHNEELTIPKHVPEAAPVDNRTLKEEIEEDIISDKEASKEITKHGETTQKGQNEIKQEEFKDSEDLKRSEEELKRSKDALGETLGEGGFLSSYDSYTYSMSMANAPNPVQSSTRLLSKGPTSENVITKRANLEGMLRLSNYGPSVNEEKDEDDIKEDIKDSTERDD